MIPRWIIDVYLLWLGCRWLCATPNFGDLLLNSVRALEAGDGLRQHQAASGSRHHQAATWLPCWSLVNFHVLLNSFKFYDVTNYIKLCYIHSVWFASNCIGSHPTHRSGICRLSADADTAQVALEFIVLLKDRFDKGRWRLTYINDVNETQT